MTSLCSAVEEHIQQDRRTTALSILDHYLARPSTATFNTMTLLEFSQLYTMPKELGVQPNRRNKKVVVITRPYCPPNPAGPKYEQYCQQLLMKHKSFQQVTKLLAGHETYTEAYAEFLHKLGTFLLPLKKTFFVCNSMLHENAANDEVCFPYINAIAVCIALISHWLM